jgi:hypothetical protein
MDPSQATPLDRLRQAEIKSSEGSFRALRYRRNELVPISSLPTELIDAIFSLLHIPGTSPPSTSTLGGKPDHLAWLRVAHVCRRWREVALNQPLFWSHIDFTTISSAGAAEILARAKTAPLHLEAKVPISHWDDSRFSEFRKELQAHVSHIRHLDLNAEPAQFVRTVKGLTSPAPTLEHLSLTLQDYEDTTYILGPIPDSLFDGFAPRLSSLELRNCGIKWTSRLLRGLEHLNIRDSHHRPSLSSWLDALDEMPQLKTLTLLWASPIAPDNIPHPSNIERTVTLPSLTLFEINETVSDCGLALAHLVLPSLTHLCLVAGSCCRDGNDVPEILPYVARHTHILQHIQPMRSVFICSNTNRVEIIACTLPDIDAELPNLDIEAPNPFVTHRIQVSFSSVAMRWSLGTHARVFDATMAALPLGNLTTLTAQKHTRLEKQFWLRHAPLWPLLRCTQLGSPAASGLREMLLDDDEDHESPLFPLLTELALFDSTLSAPRTLHLCDALMNRVEQGVPLETLDLRRCLATRRAVELLSEIVTEVLGPEGSLEETAKTRSTRWDPTARGLFVEDDSSGVEDYAEDNTDSGNDDEVETDNEWDNNSPEWDDDLPDWDGELPDWDDDFPDWVDGLP